jgi:hypothetical protein
MLLGGHTRWLHHSRWSPASVCVWVCERACVRLCAFVRAESREQRAESREQRVESREQRAESREQRAESREQRAESREQRGVTSMRGASCALESMSGARAAAVYLTCYLVCLTCYQSGTMDRSRVKERQGYKMGVTRVLQGHYKGVTWMLPVDVAHLKVLQIRYFDGVLIKLVVCLCIGGV